MLSVANTCTAVTLVWEKEGNDAKTVDVKNGDNILKFSSKNSPIEFKGKDAVEFTPTFKDGTIGDKKSKMLTVSGSYTVKFVRGADDYEIDAKELKN